jgi:probable F420-dependent oxidoreductase
MTAIHLPQHQRLVASYPQLAGELEAVGYDGLWIGEVNDLDAVVSTTLVASGSVRAAIGVLLNTFTRGPATLAMTAATLGSLAPGRMHIVLGVGSPLLVERWNGIRYERPLARLRDCLRFVRRALDGGRVGGEYETIATSGFALASVPATSPSLLVAACGPRALRLAAEEADGVVLNWLTPEDLERVAYLPAERSRVSMVVPVCPTTDRAEVDAVMRPVVADYLNAPAYADQQRRVGRGVALQPMWDAWARGDRPGARTLLPSTVLDELVISGEPDDCREQLGAIERTTGIRAIATYFPPRGISFREAALPGGAN